MTKGRVVSLELSNKTGTRRKIKASVVDEIATLKKKDKNRFDLLIRESAEEVKHKRGYKLQKRIFSRSPEAKLKCFWGKTSVGIFSLRK